MSEKIKIWLVGNTGLRNPNRIQEGFAAYASSPFVGNLREENEVAFMNFLNEKGIIQNEAGKDESGSHARKWRLMFSRNGFIYPQLKKKDGEQEELGPLDEITPFGRTFLKADTYPAVQECFLRSMSVEQYPMPDGMHYFSPLRWLLAVMLELERRTGSSELSRIEFALWGHTTNPSYNVDEVVDRILDLRQRRAAAPAKRSFDKKEIAARGENYDKKPDNFLDYSDMNMRYLRISGIFQRKGRGLIIVPTKHVLAEKLAKANASAVPIMEQYKTLCNGAPLPTDSADIAKSLLDDLIKQMRERHILFDISDLPLNTAAEINIARQRLENILAQTDEIQYANPEQLRDLILKCESRRDILEAPAWKQYIDATVSDKVTEITNGDVAQNADEAPLIPAGAIVHHTTFGVGQVVAIEAHFPECSATIELPYLHSLPDDVNFCPDGRNLMHDRFGEGIAYAYVIVFSKVIMRLSYPSAFTDGLMIVD